METKRRLALMIDGDNAQATLIGPIMTAVSKYGEITIRRVFGDWTSSHMASWQKVLNIHALQPVQQFRNTGSKNATDSALIIAVMDLLHTTDIEGYCIVSSDSDYTSLVTRIRQGSHFVIGVGRKATPPAFIQACDEFVFTDELAPKSLPTQPNTQLAQPIASPKPIDPPASPITAKKTSFKKLFRQAFAATSQEDGWAHLGALGSVLRQLDPDFDPRAYGHKLLSQMVEAHPDFFEIRKPATKTGGVYIRLKGS